MGERFLAFLCDLSVQSLIVGLFVAIIYWKTSLDLQKLKETAASLVPIVYMKDGNPFGLSVHIGADLWQKKGGLCVPVLSVLLSLKFFAARDDLEV
jgi:hypothetical protein